MDEELRHQVIGQLCDGDRLAFRGQRRHHVPELRAKTTEYIQVLLIKGHRPAGER